MLPRSTILHAAYFIVYAPMCALLAAFAFITGTEAYNIFTATPDELAGYPFGTEQGFNYTSKEIYFYSALTEFVISTQSLIFSLTLLRMKKRTAAMLIPVITAAVLYSLFQLASILYHKT